jgi:hypothetical protein
MSTLFHFGDSYGVCTNTSKHFIEICADTIGYKYSKNTNVGLSNEIIFNNIINSLYLYKTNDIIFVNFSFWVRGCSVSYTHLRAHET